MVIANNLRFLSRQGDVVAAYINAEQDKPIYMKQPSGFIVRGQDGKPKVCKLLRALEGTKRAGRLWNKLLVSFLIEQGFEQCIYDKALFKRGSLDDGNLILLVTWVDDLFAIYDPKGSRYFDEFWKTLDTKWKLKDLQGFLEAYVGVQIERDIEKRKLAMDQEVALNEIVNFYGMKNAKSRGTPMVTGLVLSRAASDCEVTDKPFRSALGSLMHPMRWTRPDIAYHVGYLSQVMSKPTDEAWKALMEVVRYIKGTASLQLVYKGRDNFDLIGYVDSDWAKDPESGKSIFGWIWYLSECPINWKSKKNQSVNTSSTTSELDGLYQCVLEGLWICEMLLWIGILDAKTK